MQSRLPRTTVRDSRREGCTLKLQWQRGREAECTTNRTATANRMRGKDTQKMSRREWCTICTIGLLDSFVLWFVDIAVAKAISVQMTKVQSNLLERDAVAERKDDTRKCEKVLANNDTEWFRARSKSPCPFAYRVVRHFTLAGGVERLVWFMCALR